MAVAPVEVTLELTPRARFDIIDVRERLRGTHGDVLDVYPRHLYHSFHTTAGYLEQSLAARLRRERSTVAPYVEVFRAMFPEGAGYEHDQLERRQDLTSAERAIENQEPARMNIESTISANANRTQLRSERTTLASTLSTPIFCAAMVRLCTCSLL